MRCGTKLEAVVARDARKTVTALFSDLVGSTSLAERHDPEVLRPLLEAYFADARAAVERHGGQVEKFIGDAVCAVFGVPAAHEDDALRAVRAGLEVQERLARLREASPLLLAVRIGITTGEVLVSGGGAPLIGDAMNTASAAIDPLEMSAVVEQRVTHPSIRGRLLARANEAEAARRCIDDAAALVAPTGLAILKADVALDRAHVLLAASDRAAAGASAEEALQRYEAKQHLVGARAAIAVLERAAGAN